MDRPPVAWLSVWMLLVLGTGCRNAATEAPDVRMNLTFDPSPPVVGDAEFSLQLTDADGSLVQGADVRVEGNMNHAGMKPSFADLEETEPGRYTGTLRFTMGGDWFLLVQAEMPDGETVELRRDVPGVKAP